VSPGWRQLPAAAILLGIAAFVCPARAQEQPPSNADCLDCHGDKDIDEGLPPGESLFVDPAHFQASVHVDLACVDCHSGATAPHEALPQVDCASCHEDEVQAWKHGSHQPGSKETTPDCVTCHTAHAILSASNPDSPTSRIHQPKLCGQCHGRTTQFVIEEPWLQRQRPFFAFQRGIHGRALAAGKAAAATCGDCHRVHDVRPPSDPSSPIYRLSVPKTCGKCHTEEAHKFLLSVHGQAAEAGAQDAPVCTSCHGIHEILPRVDPNSPIASQQIARTTCPRCHAGVRLSREYGTPAGRVNTFMDSYHGLASQRGSKAVANCASCHGVHDILPSSDPRSTIAPANVSRTCGKCHPGASENFVQVPVHGPPEQAGIASYAAEWVRTAYLWLIGVTVMFFLLVNGSDFARQLRLHLRRQKRAGVERFGSAARWQHVLLLLSFVLLVLTGFALRFPESWWARALLPVSEQTRSTLHRIGGLVLIALALLHGFTLRSGRGGGFLRRIRPGLADVRELREELAFNILGGWRRAPHASWFGLREKLEYWSVLWGTVVMAVTGLILWFEREALQWVAGWVWDVCHVIHYYEAWLALLAILFGHFYSVIFDPRVYPLDGSFLHGLRSRRRARGMRGGTKHHE